MLPDLQLFFCSSNPYSQSVEKMEKWKKQKKEVWWHKRVEESGPFLYDRPPWIYFCLPFFVFDGREALLSSRF